jgi:hypothetical protein
VSPVPDPAPPREGPAEVPTLVGKDASATGTGTGVAPVGTGRRVDRVVTFVLLGLAVYNVVSALVLVPRFSTTLLDTLRRGGYDVSSFSGEADLQRAGTTIAIVSVVVFALMIWWTLRRLRVGKVTFFVPLVAGIVVSVVQLVLVFSIFLADPAFVQSILDSGAG